MKVKTSTMIYSLFALEVPNMSLELIWHLTHRFWCKKDIQYIIYTTLLLHYTTLLKVDISRPLLSRSQLTRV